MIIMLMVLLMQYRQNVMIYMDLEKELHKIGVQEIGNLIIYTVLLLMIDVY
nr:MAG TPA: hypothetical protein [Caudoviricetes sp.]